MCVPRAARRANVPSSCIVEFPRKEIVSPPNEFVSPPVGLVHWPLHLSLADRQSRYFFSYLVITPDDAVTACRTKQLSATESLRCTRRLWLVELCNERFAGDGEQIRVRVRVSPLAAPPVPSDRR